MIVASPPHPTLHSDNLEFESCRIFQNFLLKLWGNGDKMLAKDEQLELSKF